MAGTDHAPRRVDFVVVEPFRYNCRRYEEGEDFSHRGVPFVRLDQLWRKGHIRLPEPAAVTSE